MDFLTNLIVKSNQKSQTACILVNHTKDTIRYNKHTVNTINNVNHFKIEDSCELYFRIIHPHRVRIPH